MYRADGRLVLSPSDLTRHQECHHLTTLNLAVAALGSRLRLRP